MRGRSSDQAAAGAEIVRPFRWNVARHNELGSLLDGPRADIYPGFVTDLRTLAALLIARSGPGQIVFVGRSLESVFDYLSGILAGVGAAPPVTLLQVSFSSCRDIEREAARSPDAVGGLTGYMGVEGLSAAAIARAPERIFFADVVSTGGTFGTLVALLRLMCRTEGEDWHAVERRIGFTGIVDARKTSPNTRRWWQHETWVQTLTKPRISNVSIPRHMWGFLADSMEKVTPSHVAWRWADPRVAWPDRGDDRLKALRRAVWLYDLGRLRGERARLADELARLPEMRQAWLRRLVVALRRTGGNES